MPFVWVRPRGRAGTTTRSGIVPRIFARTHHARRTPWVAIIFTTLISLLLLVGVGAEGVGTFTNATVAFLLAIALVCWCGLTLRRDLVSRAARATWSPPSRPTSMLRCRRNWARTLMLPLPTMPTCGTPHMVPP
jgi:amino acid transporter